MNKEIADLKRKTFWINPHFQKRFILFTLGTTLIIVGIGLLSNWFFVWKFIQFGNESGLPQGHNYFRFIYKQETTLNLIFLASSTLVMICSSIFGLVMSNKIAGPIYRIQRVLELRNEGRPVEKLRVRKGDFFQELATVINSTLGDSRSAKGRSKRPSLKKSA